MSTIFPAAEPSKSIEAIQSLISASPHARIEPGVLPVFRMLVGLRLVLVVPSTVLWVLYRERILLPDVFTFIALAALLGYLIAPGLPRRLDGWYLPLALTAATLEPIASLTETLRLGLLFPLPDMPEAGLVVLANWQLMTLLLIPLVLVAWQYNFHVVLMFCFVSTLLDIGLTYLVIPIDWFSPTDEWFRLHGLKMARLIAFLLAGYIVARLNYAQRLQRSALREANAKLLSYAATIEQLTVSRERNRLARELHDTLAHTLSALAVQLEAVDSAWERAPEQARGLLAKSRENARSGLTETRRALKALRASPLEDLGLLLALRTEAEAAAARLGATLAVDLPSGEINLLPDVEQGIYRIAQEALANAVKHSAARRLDVSLGVEPLGAEAGLCFAVCDNGSGFDAQRFQQGNQADRFGLRGMEERAKMLGGTLALKSAPGEGTRVELSIPQASGETLK